MDEVQYQANLTAAENTGTYYAQNKSRSGIVAEGQQTLRLRFGTLPILIECDCSAGADWVSAKKAHGQCTGTGTVQSKQRAHDGFQQFTQILG